MGVVLSSTGGEAGDAADELATVATATGTLAGVTADDGLAVPSPPGAGMNCGATGVAATGTTLVNGTTATWVGSDDAGGAAVGSVLSD